MEYLSLMSKTDTALMTPSSTQLMVNTRRGPVYFETSLEWEQAVALCQEEAQKGNKFAYDLCLRETKGLYMSQAQVSWVYKIAEDVRQLKDAPTEQTKSVQRTLDASNILASLAEARAKGIKRPILRLQRTNGTEIQLKYMSVGKNAGGAWVTQNDDLIGKIDDGGVFTFTGRPYTEQVIDEVFDAIESAHNDLEGALRSYGKMTSRCGCCGLPLTNDLSMAIGIGPICRDKFGL
jgi:hypothetical protein